MPNNYVLINNSIEFIVADSKIDDFLEYLGRNGSAVDTGIKDELDKPILTNSQT